jgi:dephospho-CoA kinase
MARQGCVIIQPNTLLHSPVALRRIGLTGGIATGKSSAARLLEQCHGLPVLDADLYARQALEPGQPATEAVLERFGTGVVSSNGVVDRRALGAIVFNNPDQRRWLEQLVHPIVRQRFDQELMRLDAKPAVVLMIPLMFESGLERICSETWLVDCDESQQLQRLMARDQLSAAEAQARINAQWPLAKKRPLADVLISNRSDTAALSAQLAAALSPLASG